MLQNFYDLILKKEPPIFSITGPAGTGKSYLVREALLRDSTFGIVTASTGIAAMNMGDAITVHSLLKVFNERSIEYAYEKGSLTKKLEELAAAYKFILIDEAYMLNAKFVGTLYLAVKELNQAGRKFGIILIGDPAQLAPIPYDRLENGEVKRGRTGKALKETSIPWLWNNAEIRKALAMEGHSIKLTKIYRQDNQGFIEALMQMRTATSAKDLSGVIDKLVAAGVTFTNNLDPDFEGTTLLAVNDEVDRANNRYLMNFKPEEEITYIPSYQWFSEQVDQPDATHHVDWNTIPKELGLKVGARVMLLANQYDVTGTLLYSNGDTGTVKSIDKIARPHVHYIGYDEDQLQSLLDKAIVTMDQLRPKHRYETPFADLIDYDYKIIVTIERPNGETKDVMVNRIVRDMENYGDIEAKYKTHGRFPKDDLGQPTRITKNEDTFVWVTGQISYYPIRLAKFTTIHKSQGLTLDKLQVSLQHSFMKQPSMVYTAFSRVRDPKNLRIVGTPLQFLQLCRASPEILPYV